MPFAVPGIVLTVVAFAVPVVSLRIFSLLRTETDQSVPVSYGLLTLAIWLISGAAAVWLANRALRVARFGNNRYELVWSYVSVTVAVANAIWTAFLVMVIIGAFTRPTGII